MGSAVGSWVGKSRISPPGCSGCISATGASVGSGDGSPAFIGTPKGSVAFAGVGSMVPLIGGLSKREARRFLTFSPDFLYSCSVTLNCVENVTPITERAHTPSRMPSSNKEMILRDHDDDEEADDNELFAAMSFRKRSSGTYSSSVGVTDDDMITQLPYEVQQSERHRNCNRNEAAKYNDVR